MATTQTAHRECYRCCGDGVVPARNGRVAIECPDCKGDGVFAVITTDIFPGTPEWEESEKALGYTRG
jgi:hypothetical protein